MPATGLSPAPGSLTSGSVEAFRAGWGALDEGERYHFRRGEPETQVQFAFQNHWRVFCGLMKGGPTRGRVLEVGCGRGSMAAFFADAGYAVHMLDTSLAALNIATRNFAIDGLEGRAIGGDARALPYRNGTFDVVVSIGLLEHFDEVATVVGEQMRVLRPGGLFLGYVVPQRRLSVQMLAGPVNAMLRARMVLRSRSKPKVAAKPALYRNDFESRTYLDVLDSLGSREAGAFGMFPVPLISHSPHFPFTPNDPPIETRIVRAWRWLLRGHWTCPERFGLAFLVWGRKG